MRRFSISHGLVVASEILEDINCVVDSVVVMRNVLFMYFLSGNHMNCNPLVLKGYVICITCINMYTQHRNFPLVYIFSAGQSHNVNHIHETV